jgi:serine/threonine protein kinase
VNFGRFQIRGRLGEGAAGAVHRAFDPELGREVALKRLHQVDELKGKRFEREAEVTAGLTHPGILKVHTFGVLEKTPYLVYELVEGAQTFDEAIAGLDLEARVGLVRQAALAIGYAHERGVVHRDLKPSNLLVDTEGRLRVADFGVATGQDLERLTKTGVWVGTPLYMAPEQLYCERERFGPHTDVWALGAMLFEALTGELPFKAETPMELLSVARAGVRSPRSLRPELPLALEQICLRALELETSARYATGARLAAALTGYLEEGKGEEPPRSKAWAVVMVIALTAAIAGLLAADHLQPQSAQSPRPTLVSLPSETASPSPTPADEEQYRARAEAALEEAMALTDEGQRMVAVSDWCLDNPSHPRLRKGQRVRDQLCWQHPVLEAQIYPHERGPTRAVMTGDSFLVFQAANTSHRASKVQRVRLAGAESRELELEDPLGVCSLPGGGYALLLKKEGLLVAEGGGEPRLVRLASSWDEERVVFLSSQPARSGGSWFGLGTTRRQVVIRVAGGRVVEERALRGWPESSHLRGVLLTPGERAILFGIQTLKSGVDTGVALRCDTRSGAVVDRLVEPGELNAVYTAAYDPRDPERILIGTRFGHVLLLGKGPRMRFGSERGSQLGFGKRAHTCAVRYVGFWRDDKILSVSSDPGISGVLKVWRASDGYRLDSVDLFLTTKDVCADDRHLLMVGAKRARVYRLD